MISSTKSWYSSVKLKENERFLTLIEHTFSLSHFGMPKFWLDTLLTAIHALQLQTLIFSEIKSSLSWYHFLIFQTMGTKPCGSINKDHYFIVIWCYRIKPWQFIYTDFLRKNEFLFLSLSSALDNWFYHLGIWPCP